MGETTPLEIQPRNMQAYIPYQTAVLEHGHFRWLQKASVSILGLRPQMRVGCGDSPRYGVVPTPQGRTIPSEYHPLSALGRKAFNKRVRVRILSDGIYAQMNVLDCQPPLTSRH
jgi:hypothetical protein